MAKMYFSFSIMVSIVYKPTSQLSSCLPVSLPRTKLPPLHFTYMLTSDLTYWPLTSHVDLYDLFLFHQNPERPATHTFVTMAAMHSEILLVSSRERILYSWSCTDAQAPPRPHPLNKDLGLEGERISLLESSDVRTTVVTESGRIATFYDSLLRGM